MVDRNIRSLALAVLHLRVKFCSNTSTSSKDFSALLFSCRFVLFRALSGQLLNADQNEFGGLEGRETYDNVEYSRVDVILSCGCFVAPDKESIARFRSLKRSLPKQTSHKGAEARTNLCPKQIIVGLENRPLRAPRKTLFEIKRQAPHGDVFPLTRILIRTRERARAPGDISDLRKSP